MTPQERSIHAESARKAARWVALCVPTDTDGYWYVYDTHTQTSDPVDTYATAIKIARHRNRIQQEGR